jgi:hypothetical protein
MTKLTVALRNSVIVPKTKEGWLSLPLRVLLTLTNAKFWIVLNYKGRMASSSMHKILLQNEYRLLRKQSSLKCYKIPLILTWELTLNAF